MSRTETRRCFSLEEDRAVLDETPRAYKSIDRVMHAQRDLVDMVHELRQLVCVKGVRDRVARRTGLEPARSATSPTQFRALAGWSC